MNNTHRHRKFKMQSATTATARASAVKCSFIGAAVMFILAMLIIGLTLGVDPKTDADIIPEIMNSNFDAQDVKGIALLFALTVCIVGAILIGVGVCNQRHRLPEHTDSETTRNETTDLDLPVATEAIEMNGLFSRERSGSSESSTESSTNS